MLEKEGGAVWLEKYPSLHSSLASELECMKSEQCKITARAHYHWMFAVQV